MIRLKIWVFNIIYKKQTKYKNLGFYVLFVTNLLMIIECTKSMHLIWIPLQVYIYIYDLKFQLKG